MPRDTINILLLEDNRHDAGQFTRIMADRANVLVAGDGGEALDRAFQRGRFRTDPPLHVVVLDLNTPLMSGHEVLNVLKANSQTANLPVIVWSGSTNPQDVRKALALGASAYMVKDMDMASTEFRLRAFVDFWAKSVEYPAKLGATA